MKYPYLITSDQHCHAWTSFAKVNPDGVNSRLRIILDELKRAHEVLRKAGGNGRGLRSFYAGDLFHVRGKIEPSVFNPTFAAIKDIQFNLDVVTHAIPGNHDLEGNNAEALGNAMQQLGTIENFHVHIEPTLVDDTVLVIPWIKDLNHLRQVIGDFQVPDRSKIDVIIHAPLNGVIQGLPDHGLDPKELAAFGFRRVFCGHYHNHIESEPGVYSIGATTHQTWSDPGTKAGFLLVYEDRVEFHENEAPKFVDLNEKVIEDAHLHGVTVDMLVEGNYVRMKLVDVEEKDIRSWRESLAEAGALGVLIKAENTSTVTRSGASAMAAVSLEASVQHYIDNDMKPLHADEVSKLAMDVLQEARA